MKRLALTLLLLSLAACEESRPLPAQQPSGDPTESGDPTAAGEPVLAADEVPLPAGWEGEGTLVRRQERIPRRAPRWAAIAAEVVRRDEQRFLQATGKAERIKNSALARSTAEARALAEIARWVRSEHLVGTTAIDVWRDPKTGVTFARVAMPVPDDWIPGRPLQPTPPPDDVQTP
jgi:hypothetical protein